MKQEMIKEVSDWWGCDETEEVIARSAYKYNDCGPEVSFTEDAMHIDAIVEGVEECAATQVLVWPFTEDEYEAAMALVEADVRRIWYDTHGCDGCDSPEEDGVRVVDPDCKKCDGDGVTI